MAVTETLMWTALPNGITGPATARRLRLSVYVSPRVGTDGAPSAAPPVLGPCLADWPANLRRAAWSVHVEGRDPVPAEVTSAAPDSGLWQALFGPATPVTPHVFTDLSDQATYATYPIASLHAQVKAGHQELAAGSALGMDAGSVAQAFPGVFAPAPDGPPPTADGIAAETDPERLRALHAGLTAGLVRPRSAADRAARLAAATAAARRLAELTGRPTPVVPISDEPGSDFAQLTAFHHGAARPAGAPAPDGPPRFDFHQALTFLADHPVLLRPLGLVIDLELPADAIPPSEGHHPQILCAEPRFDPPLPCTHLYPYTAYNLTGDRFFEPATREQSTELLHGLVDLADPDTYRAVQLDVDGAALKLLNLAAQPDGAADVPTLRTSGVTIACAGLAERLYGQMETAATNDDDLASGAGVVLYAEDVVRGYRFDVRDAATATWHSLHRRTGTYTFTAHPAGPHTITAADEGVHQVSLTRPPRPDGSPDPDAPLFIHESLLHWYGWSLAAPRPGKVVTDDGAGTAGSAPAPGGIPLACSFAAEPGTLPRLRFGRAYAFRARTVDLAGNGLDGDGADALLAYLADANQPAPVLPIDDPESTYRRYEPVTAPVLVPRERLTAGESAQCLVIRSRAGVSAADYATALSREVRTPFRPTCDRHLVPPKTTQSLAETSGLLDASFGTGAGSDRTYAIARKDAGTLTDTRVLDTSTGKVTPIPDTTAPDPVTGKPVTRPSVETVASGPGSGYVLHHEPRLRTPYLPDPLAAGAALCGLPGMGDPAHQAARLDPSGKLVYGPSPLAGDSLLALGGATLHLGFTGTWPEREPFLLRLAEPPDPRHAPAPPPDWDPDGRVLTVYLAKAGRARIRLSSYLSAGDDTTGLRQLGLWEWVSQSTDRAVTPDDVLMAQQGGHRLLCPYRELELVHAVERPLAAPQVQNLRVPRDRGATFTYVGATVPIHDASTGKLDLLAEWTEQTDGPDGPATVSRTAHLCEAPIVLPTDGGPPPPPATGENPAAVYDPDRHAVDFPAPQPGDTGVYLSRQEFGDTRHRHIRYRAVATTRFAEFFPAAVTADPARITISGAAEIDVPASARPAAPDVVSVLPTFTWSRTTAKDGTRTSYRGCGLRVYVTGPWFSSGDGELLGVVTSRLAGDLHLYEPLRPYVTHLAQDPTVVTAFAPPVNPSDFAAPAATRTGLTLDEVTAVGAALPPEAGSLDVAGFPVTYDPDRKLWSADLGLDITDASYFPFIRLALARYQPNALPGCELSPVVLADYAQVPPGRTVTLTPQAPNPDGTRPLALTVTGSGVATYQSNAWSQYQTGQFGRALPDLVTVTVEQRVPGTAGDLGWTDPDDSAPAFDVHTDTACPAGGGGTTAGEPLWQGTVTVPAGLPAGRYRIAVREYEHHFDDRQDFGTQAHHPGAGRLVFAEHFTL